MTPSREIFFPLRRSCVAAVAALCLACATAHSPAQTSTTAQASPASSAPAQTAQAPQAAQPASPKAISSSNLLDRPYGGNWPKPSFPSSDREKKQFTVEYVYRYVESEYTPAVEIPTVLKSQAQTDTPEHTLIALISAMKTLDYDWWLSLWDTKSQELFRDEAKTKKQDAAYWKPIWQAGLVGKPVTLYSRLETPFDITLEFRIGAQQPNRPSTLFPAVFKYESGHWALTRELGESSFLPWMGRPTLSLNIDLIPVPEYSGKPLDPAAMKAQSLFFTDQARGEDSATDFVW
jgi:hypothetical protein